VYHDMFRRLLRNQFCGQRHKHNQQ